MPSPAPADPASPSPQPYRRHGGSLTAQLSRAIAHPSEQARQHFRQLAFHTGPTGRPTVTLAVAEALAAGFPDPSSVLKRMSFMELCFRHGQQQLFAEIVRAQRPEQVCKQATRRDTDWLALLCSYPVRPNSPGRVLRSVGQRLAITRPLPAWAADFLCVQLAVDPQDAELPRLEARSPEVAAVAREARMQLRIEAVQRGPQVPATSRPGHRARGV